MKGQARNEKKGKLDKRLRLPGISYEVIAVLMSNLPIIEKVLARKEEKEAKG